MPSSQSSSERRNISIAIDIAVIVLRILVGATFIVSGFAKAIDPWGTVYKMAEYAAVWEWAFPQTLLVSGAFMLALLEFFCGAMLILGCYRRSIIVIMLLIMAFMLLLTLYISISNPVSDCGCFGDLWKVSNGVTFLKNLLITAALVFLLFFNRRVRTIITPYLQWIGALLSIIFPFIIAFIGYNSQPLLDFRQYDYGTKLIENSESGEQAEDSFIFIYEREGEKKEFSINELPDSSWKYVERRVSPDAINAKDDFSIYDVHGEEIGESIIENDGIELLVLVPSLKNIDISSTYYLNETVHALEQRNIPVIGIVGGDDKDIELWQDLSMADYPIFNADILQMKELVRGKIGIVILNDGKILWKGTVNSFLRRLNNHELNVADFDFKEISEYQLGIIVTVYIASLLVLIVFNNGVLALAHWIKNKIYNHNVSRLVSPKK